MPKYILLALNGPTDGEDDEQSFNDWYDAVHIPDLAAIAGITSARRFKVISGKRADWPYVAAYEIETDDLAGLMKDLETRPRPFTPAFDKSTSAFVLAIETGGGV